MKLDAYPILPSDERQLYIKLTELLRDLNNQVNYLTDTVAGLSGGGVSDGDKGDVTVSGSGTVWTVDGKDAASGFAMLNASSRITKGVDTTDDVIINLATKGLVLKDTQGTPHYWRVTVSNAGALITADLGTTKP